MARSSQGEVLTGTTIIACSYDGGVVLGADSRTSSGSYVANKAADKITKVCDKVWPDHRQIAHKTRDEMMAPRPSRLTGFSRLALCRSTCAGPVAPPTRKR